jgi:hypothetical protein
MTNLRHNLRHISHKSGASYSEPTRNQWFMKYCDMASGYNPDLRRFYRAQAKDFMGTCDKLTT